jgi:hypothetical protein
MRRLFYWTLVGITALVCAMAVLISSNRKSRDLLGVLSTNPNGTTCENRCLFGTQPERMDYSHIQSLLMTHPLLQGLHVESRPNTYDHFFGRELDVDHGDGYVSVQFHEPPHCNDDYPECHAHPNNIILKSLRKDLPLGTVIANFGTPDFMELDTGDSGVPLISIFYRDAHLGFQYQLAQGRAVSTADIIDSVNLYSAAAFDYFTHDKLHYHWQGFVSLELIPTPLSPNN